jgi:hypothetical protein
MSDEKHKPWCSEQARKENGGCICQAHSELSPARGSARGGPEIWNVVAWGGVRECRDIETIMDEVREALELGYRTISIEKQGAPNASPTELSDSRRAALTTAQKTYEKTKTQESEKQGGCSLQ